MPGLWLLWIALCGLPGGSPAPGPQAAPGAFRAVDAEKLPDVFVWTDTCNVYVLRSGEAALLIDLGDGSLLDHLGEIGVKRVEWVLFTHHHREQCQGAPRLRGTETRLAGPEAERALFEEPTSFRKLNVALGDPFTIHGTSYVRPPIVPIRLDRFFRTGDLFSWHGRELECLETPGNSPGGITYRLRGPDLSVAFSGDVILAGARMHTWFDTEWDYGFAAGIQALRKTVDRLAAEHFDRLLPAHGSIIEQSQLELRKYAEKLAALERLYVRGYGVGEPSIAYQDKVSKPTAVPDV